MAALFSRRGFLGIVPALPLGLSFKGQGSATAPNPRFPAQGDDAVKEMVTVAHGNLARVRELVTARPALARASWDWGYGDWETAIDAASHVGSKPVVELLVASGARPTIFTAVMLGQVSIVKSWFESSPALQRMRGPHGLTMVAHARAGGDGNGEMLKYLASLGDADPQYVNLPLTDAEQASMPGEYAFGPGAADRLQVVKGVRGFTIERPGGAPRSLFHQGGLVFLPSGAEAVRIRFDARSLTIEDGALRVTAERV